MTARSCRIALYSHDTMGIGHMRRNLLIAQALAASPLRPTTLLIAGAREATLFDPPPRVDFLTLPSLHKSAAGVYGARSLEVSADDLVDLRSHVLRGSLDAFDPDLLIVDKVPRGALGELDDALRSLRRRGRARCVLGLRDVLDDPMIVRPEWAADAAEQAIRDYYDAVWVYGSPAVYDLAREYDLADDVAAKIRYTGFLSRRAASAVPATASGGAPDPAADDDDETGGFAPPGGRRLALCMVGGGQDGAALAEAFVAAPLPRDTCALVVTGPFMSRQAKDRLRAATAGREHIRLLDFSARPDALIDRADRVVCMGGYNTVYEVLAARKHALVVPRVRPRREQLIRAERLRSLGMLDMLEPERATPAALGRWLADDLPPPAPFPLAADSDGVDRLAALAADVLSDRPHVAAASPAPGNPERVSQHVA